MSFTNAPFGNQCKHFASGWTGKRSRSLSWRRAVGTLLFASFCASGCARRAYNDVYVENMAAEIRDLEDQLYEFDGEYRVMEQQLDSLRAENARLKSSLPAPVNNRTLRQEVVPSPRASTPSNSSEFFVPRAGASSSPPASSSSPSSPSSPLPPSSSSLPSSSAPGSGKSTPSPAPTLDIGPAAPAAPTKPFTPPSANAPTISPPPSLTPAPLPAPKPAPGADQFNPNDLLPPTIDQGEPMPPNLPPISSMPNNPVTMQTDNDLELELGQIKLPAQLASLRSSAGPDGAIVQDSQIHSPAQLPDDTRIVDLKFHPSLCRSVNTDQQGDDDGLYLVLQPYNAAGEFVALPADLMVLALDLSRPEKQATIGRWTMSAADVKSKINPIGSSQGIHLSLSFSGPAPQCDKVLVFAYYTLPDGRRLVKEHEVMLNNIHRQNAVWVPRSKSEVRAVNHEVPVGK